MGMKRKGMEEKKLIDEKWKEKNDERDGKWKQGNEENQKEN